jgi:hypothetical protein
MPESARELACVFLLGVVAWATPAWAWGPSSLVAAQTLPGQAPPPAPDTGAPPPPDTGAPSAPDTGAPPPPDANAPAAPPEAGPAPAWPPPRAAPPVPPQLQTIGQPEDAFVLEVPGRPPVARPRLSAAVGMGGSFDAVGFADRSARAIPAFFTVLGIGDGPLGLDLWAFASQAAGRHGTQTPVDRLAVDLFGVLRPAGWFRPGDPRYQLRLLHGIGVELGLGFERDGVGAVSGTRFLIHTGARVDVPLTPAREPTEVRLRLAVRRGVGLYTPTLYTGPTGSLKVDDSAVELYAALVVVF